MTQHEMKTLGVLALAVLVVSYLVDCPALLWLQLVLLLCLIFDLRLGHWIAAGWLRFAHVLGAINSRILLTVIFYGFLVPFAWLYRRVHKAGVAQFRGKATTASAFQPVVNPTSRQSFERIW